MSAERAQVQGPSDGGSLILASVPLKAVLPTSRTIPPHVAVVFDDGCGGLYWQPGKPPRTGLRSGYRVRHEVDISDKRRIAELRNSRLLAHGDAYEFAVRLSVGFRVADPVMIVRRRIVDGAALVYDYLLGLFRPIARRYDIQDAGLVEQEINALFAAGPHRVPEGIEIFFCRVEVEPDVAARGHQDAIESATRRAREGEAEKTVEEGRARRAAEIERIELDARLDRERTEREAVARFPVDLRSMIREHLARHPENSAHLLDMIRQLNETEQQERVLRGERADQVMRFLVEHDLVKTTAEAERVRAHMLDPDGGQARSALPRGRSSEDLGLNERLPFITATADAKRPGPVSVGRVLPVYVLVDESCGDPDYIDTLTDGLGGLCAGLAEDQVARAVLRLAVVGFAQTAVLRMPLTTVSTAGAGQGPQPRSGLDYARLFHRLYEIISADIDRLKAHEPSVGRPFVYLLSASGIGADAAARSAHRRLTDRTAFRYAPNIVVCSMDAGGEHEAAEFATDPGMAFLASADLSLNDSAICATSFLADSLRRTSAAHVRGEEARIIAPEGFTPATDRP